MRLTASRAVLRATSAAPKTIVQEACLRAFKFIDTFRAGNSRAWFLSIVRNTYYSDLKKNRAQAMWRSRIP